MLPCNPIQQFEHFYKATYSVRRSHHIANEMEILQLIFVQFRVHHKLVIAEQFLLVPIGTLFYRHLAGEIV